MEETDVRNCKLLKSIVASGKFEVKGDAIRSVAQVLSWLDTLELKIKAAIPDPGPVDLSEGELTEGVE